MSRMSGLNRLLRAHGLDIVIVLATLEAALEIVFTEGQPNSPQTPLWFSVPAVAAVILPLLARRRFPFSGPVALWLLAAGLSFADGRLIVSAYGIYVAGIIAAYLLGNLRDVVQARIGLAAVLLGALIVVYNDPRHTAGEYVFIPLFFVIAWLAGFAVRERVTQVEAAEERAAVA